MMALLSTINALAHDIAVENEDGVTIYYNYINGGLELEVTYRDNEVDPYNRDDYSGVVVIPDEVTFMTRKRKVSGIGYSAFHGCRDITKVIIPSTVTYIRDRAFCGCFKLMSINIPSSVTSIADYTFSGCEELTSINIPSSVTSIGNFTFYDCQLKTLEIPSSVTIIGTNAFECCTSLASIIIPQSVISIGNYAFSKCSSLTSITIPESVSTISDYTFSHCEKLTSATIANGVKSICQGAFEYCTNLASIIIPNSITSIGPSAFEGVDFTAIVSQIDEPFDIQGKNSGKFGTFSLNTFNNTTLYVPVGTINKYKTTEGWKDFLFIEEGDGGDIPTPLGDIITLADFTNGGFEKWAQGVPLQWMPDNLASNATISQSTDAHGGRFSVRVEGKTSSNQRLASIGLMLEAGEYKMTFFIKPEANGGCVRPGYALFEEGGNISSYVYGDKISNLPAGQWTKVSYSFMLSEKTNLNLIIMNPKDPGKSFLVDDFSVIQIGDFIDEIAVRRTQTNTPISVYDLGGRFLGTTVNTKGTTQVNHGSNERIVVVRIGERAVKVVR